MYHNTTTYALLKEHFQRYPLLQPQDVLKFLHQSTFGCGHLIASPTAAAAYIRQEMGQCADSSVTLEDLDGDFCRVHLSYTKKLGVSADTLAKLLAQSAQEPCGNEESLETQLTIALSMAKNGEFPFSFESLNQEIIPWRSAGFPARHHSEVFRNAYAPAYRVIKKEYAQWLPLLAKIETEILKKSPALIAIEGGSASGKTTLSQLLSEVYDCNVFHMDDFFLRPEQRTEERFAQAGGNVDHERFLGEVLLPLSQGKTVQYRAFDCSTFTLRPAVEIAPKKLNIIEGAYSMHPQLAQFYDFSVFLSVTPQLQRKRIEKRNSPEMAQRFFDTWIPLERTYFEATDAAARCSMIWEVKE